MSYLPPQLPPPYINHDAQYSQIMYGKQPQQDQQYDYYYQQPPPGYTASQEIAMRITQRFCWDWWRQRWVFMVNVGMFVMLAVLFIHSLPSTMFDHKLQNTKEFYSWSTMVMMTIFIVVGFVISLAYLLLVQAFAGPMLVFSFCFLVAVTIGGAIYYLVAHIWFVGIILMIFGILYAISWFVWRKYIPFSKAILESVYRAIHHFKSVLWISFGFIILSALFNAVWTLSFAGSFRYLDKYKSCSEHVDRTSRRYQSCSNAIQYVTWVYMVFAYYWISQVISNVLHTTICGVFATYFFFPDKNCCVLWFEVG